MRGNIEKIAPGVIAASLRRAGRKGVGGGIPGGPDYPAGTEDAKEDERETERWKSSVEVFVITGTSRGTVGR